MAVWDLHYSVYYQTYQQRGLHFLLGQWIRETADLSEDGKS